MANQSKKYNKFIVSSVAATLAVTAAAPIAGFAAADKFSDVKGHWSADAVDYLVGKGAISGYSDGTFKPDGQITRAEAATMLAATLNLNVDTDKKTNFTDAKNHWASSFIAAIQDQLPGVIGGYEDGSFRPDRKITRQEMAKMITTAYGIKLNNNAVVDFDDNNSWGAENINILASQGIVVGQSEGKFVPEANVTRGETATFIHRAEVEEVRVKVKGKEVAVESVKAVNAKTIEVTFTKEIDEDTLKDAENKDIITLARGTGAVNPGAITQELSEDGKTLTLTAAEYFKGDYTVRVPFEIVKTADGRFVNPVNYKVTVNDVTAPVLTAATTTVRDADDAITNITLTFDEDVKSIGNVKIDGKNYDAVVNGKEATVAVDNLAGGKTYDVTVVNAQDFAGNTKAIQEAKLSVEIDNEAPTITAVEVTGEKTVKVTFDEPLKDNELEITGKIGAFTADVVESAEVNEDNNKEYTVTLKEDYLYKNGNRDTVTLTIAKGAIEDALGNANEVEITKTALMIKDTTAPYFKGVEPTKTDAGKVTGFVLTFDEEVESLDTSKIDVVNAKGEIFSFANIATATISEGNAKKVVFTFKDGAKADQYRFTFEKGFVTDQSLANNESEKFTANVELVDPAQPEPTTFDIAGAEAKDNVITVDFGEKVKRDGTGSALNAAAYELNGKKLPANTEIVYAQKDGNVDQTKVIITLPEGFVESNDDRAVFRVLGNESLENKENAAFTTEVKVTDNTPPAPQSFVTTDLDELTVTYSEALVALGEEADVTDELKLVDADGNTIAIDGATVTEDGKLVLTVEGDATKVAKLTTVATTIDAVDLKDAAGNAQKVEVTVTK